MADTFPIELKDSIAKITLSGRLDTTNAPEFAEKLKELVGQDIKEVVYYMEDLDYISSAGLRVIVFSKQKLGSDTTVYVIKPKQDVLDVIKLAGFDSFLIIQDSYGE